jgi:hypothetical protein
VGGGGNKARLIEHFKPMRPELVSDVLEMLHGVSVNVVAVNLSYLTLAVPAFADYRGVREYQSTDQKLKLVAAKVRM